MHLLPLLPPIKMPTPKRYEMWWEELLDSLPPCQKCNGARQIECDECDGDGYSEYCECGSEKDCDDCNGTGDIECECTGSTSRHAYIKQITQDYRLLLDYKRFTMPDTEIARLAKHNAQLH